MMRHVATISVLTLAACSPAPVEQLDLYTRTVPLIEVDGLLFRDLDRDGTLTPYEDWRLTPQQRAADLVERMTLAEKAGAMVVGNLPGNAPPGEPATGYDPELVAAMVGERFVTHAVSRLSTDTRALAEANNAVQEAAEQGRLGIPVLLTTDPRHGFTELAGATTIGGQFSQWPNGVGIAALNDPALTRAYAELVRDDLRAVGFAQLLGPQIDLASEPRWPRNFDTYGEDPEVAAQQAEAFVTGLQGGADGIAPGGVAAVVKHFAGYGASDTGFDAHNYYGRHSRVSSEEWPLQMRPFEGAFRANPAGVMPSYSILLELEIDGEPVEQVGAGYSRQLLTGELRERLGFSGVILSDWAITNDCTELCRDGHPAGEEPTFASVSTAWGVEDLSRPERFAKALAAGMDQFGGVDDPAPLIAAVEQGLVGEADLMPAVTRILEQKFALGLFDAPFVDPEAAAGSIGTPEELARGLEAQAASMVVLEGAGRHTLGPGSKVVLFGLDPAAASAAGFVPVSDPAQADAAILRTRSPSELLHPGYVFGAMHQEGSLAFPADHPALAFMALLPEGMLLVADVQIDRPAIMGPFKDRAQVLLASFGAGDRALLDVLTGKIAPRGQLPFELPSSMDAVEAQRPGMPADSRDPLYSLGLGSTGQ
ncbi:glycoside hydrolase family 3 protein [Altererythrobacter sp. KTW20L]|uniref:glycoside hydrolase family 3 protein n=1 Tax=Altererythrobacter sp. KTW20L TaxID=2942210 RepID=UPI0020C13513|nr:glycoside hydrolase family 3 N-terminal domain-containing protein [Altererythrobacter sp. KTW20L]MCL6251641.1 glycoside hydrolase family 3 protein [Altererythrobacter sp. KTW20L]